MGADGHIRIWRRDEVEKVFPDCAELFEYIPTHYCHELDGIKYDHCYHGDNLMFFYWGNIEDCYTYDIKNNPEKMKRLKEFLNWLDRNGTQWEVWT